MVYEVRRDGYTTDLQELARAAAQRRLRAILDAPPAVGLTSADPRRIELTAERPEPER